MAKRKKSITVFAPASSANLGSGFDVFGLAVDGPGDFLRLEENGTGTVRIRSISGDGGRLSKVAEENTAGVALISFLKALGVDKGFDILLRKKLPLGSGLGSSAASAVAAVFAANELLGRPMKKKELIRWAAEGERVASGSVHADNIAPSMLGGITLVRSMNAEDIIALPVPSGMRLTVVHPHVEVKTSDARKVLPREIPLKTAITQWANTSALTAACFSNDLSLFGRSMTDLVAEPARRMLIPCYDEVKSVALASGALGCCISGAGPSVLAVFDSVKSSATAAAAMRSVYRSARIGCDVYVTKVDRRGARIVR
ncbi:MAG: homoserine kinase [Bacteroidota bacterium]